MTEIRTIEPKDLKDLALLYEELVRRKTNIEKMEANYAYMLKDGSYILIGAFEEGKLAGSVMGIVCMDLVGECHPFMVVENVIVSSSYKRMGIGRILMQSIEEEAVKRNCYYIMLVSRAERVEAHKFYESVGYDKDPVRGFKKVLQ